MNWIQTLNFLTALALSGCQSRTYHLPNDADLACVFSAEFVHVTSSYKTRTCSRLYGNAILETSSEFQPVIIKSPNIDASIDIHADLLNIPDDLASKHHIESAFRAGIPSLSKKLKQIWPDSPPLCWKLRLVPEQVKLNEEYTEKAKGCIPIKLTMHFQNNGNFHYGIAENVAKIISIQLHETCHALSRLEINRKRSFFRESDSEELACTILSAWAEPFTLASIFEQNVKTSYPDTDPSWHNAIEHFEVPEKKYVAIQTLARLMTFNRICESSINTTNPKNDKILELFRTVYSVELPVREIVEKEFSSSCDAF